MEILIIIVSIPVLLLLQGFFSGSEIALVNCDKNRLRHNAKAGQPGSTLALKMLERPEVVLTTTLVGTNISLVLMTVLFTTLAVALFGDQGDLLAVLLLTPATLIFGEVVPKSIFQQQADRLTPKISYVLYFLSLLLFPVVFLFSRVARLAAHILGHGRPGAEMFAVREQLRAVLETAESSSLGSPIDRIRMQNVVRFGELSAGDMMVPAAEMAAIDSTEAVRDAVNHFRKTGDTHIPVYEGRKSNITGMVSMTVWNLIEKDLYESELKSLVKPALFIPALQPVAELLPQLQSREDQSAVVVDEFGSAIGLITTHMILESIVGNVEVGTTYEEKTSKKKPSCEELDEDTFLMDARLPVKDVNQILVTNISTAIAHTIGGLIVARLRHVPKVGESITEDGFKFTVEKATERAITRIKAERIS